MSAPQETTNAVNEPVSSSQAAAPEASTPAPKEDGVKVFAGNLSYKATDQDLKSLFEPVGGEIVSAQIVFRGQRSSGYGFVTYKSTEEAEKAVQALNQKDVEGRAIVVELARPSQPKEKKPRNKKPATPRGRPARAEDAVDGEETEGAEASTAEGATVPKTKKRPNKKRGKKTAATVEGESSQTDAAPAEGEAEAPKTARRKKATPSTRIDDESGDAAPRAKKERAPRAPREPPTGEPHKTLVFVANLPFSMDDEGLHKLFTESGISVATARIVRRQFGVKRSKGFGFVDTTSTEEQQKALSIDGKDLDGRNIAVKVALDSQRDPENPLPPASETAEPAASS
ncbi:FOG: RRM domain [Phaffia rhodozyma]|uniref:FOG: RRM domain n=1 Tax=Phaffia rhodozyma TaxID=264483 RepID=A0A0F7SM49_PHARH|nr:FOG: RRM domain [Phaffia rhodozyma]